MKSLDGELKFWEKEEKKAGQYKEYSLQAL